MNEEHVQRQRIIVRQPPDDALRQISEGRKFVVVDDSFTSQFIPANYTLINMRYKGEAFKMLVPQSLLYFIANPGEGDADDALDEIADFYRDAETFEDEQMENGRTSVQGANWATLARNSYSTYLINALVEGTFTLGGFSPRFRKEVFKQLGFNDRYIHERVKAMAALALGKTSTDQVKEYGLEGLLNHITVQERGKKTRMTREELEKVACYYGSHWELKPEFKNDNNFEYHAGMYRDGSDSYKTARCKKVEVFDAKLHTLEQEIAERRQKLGLTAGRHDTAMTRQYANIAFIAPENKKAQLDVTPPKEWKKDEQRDKS